jgi:peptidoglycan/xylan/chitin deacetylase (PgdA/CDA1 family)
MPDHDRYPYRSTFEREAIQWPNGARLAFYVGINIEFNHFDRPGRDGPSPDLINHVMWEYGARVGVYRIMQVLDKHRLRASVLLNSDVCLYQPQIIAEGNTRDWEWLGHGMVQKAMPSYPADEERAVIREVKETIARHTGKVPRGWLGPGLAESFRTPDHLAAEGFEYVCDWSGDDQPLAMRVATGRLIAMPYHNGINDQRLIARYFYTGSAYKQAVCDQFDVLYGAASTGGGLVMAMPIHPPNVGQPFYLKYFDEALSYICSHEGVWLTVAGEIADWYYAHYYQPPAP